MPIDGRGGIAGSTTTNLPGLEIHSQNFATRLAKSFNCGILPCGIMRKTFIETSAFTVRWRRRGNDDLLRKLQSELLQSPDRGDPMPGCAILRKYRFADPSRGKGKRGGLRVIYLHTPAANWIHLITVFGKDEQSDISRQDMKELCELARLLRREAEAADKKGSRS